MIRIFRRMRRKLADRNQVIKYSKYAIGEILLVVIGILIALQVNNWNEKKKEQVRIKSYAESLIQDLENDIKMIDTIQYVATEINIRIDSLSKYILNNEIEELLNLDIFCLSWMKLYRPYSWNRATLDELKNSGGLQLVHNAQI